MKQRISEEQIIGPLREASSLPLGSIQRTGTTPCTSRRRGATWIWRDEINPNFPDSASEPKAANMPDVIVTRRTREFSLFETQPGECFGLRIAPNSKQLSN